ncbi:restriction endonuclease subunit S [Vreelandella alkaliphila]|uniref:restriction endonuclease subunit S n=1 Tax=Halomonadaceae TaxID=28256 RepID=UPI0018669706|nr:restriction endonuclease subunit S [Halomonas sp. FME65]
MTFPKYPEYKNSGVEWLGEVPAHWEVAPVASKFELRNGYPFKAELFTPEGVPSDRLIRIRDILRDGSRIFTPESCPSWAMVKDGDVLIGMDGDFNVVYWNKGLAKLNQRVCAIRGQSVAWDKFLFYGITQPLNIINDLTFSTTVKHLSSSQVLKTRFPLPLESEVSNIVAFLDHETARIDALVEEQQRLIALLKEKRQAVISHAVTKGLDPDVPLKDSGVEWLGEVPEHWEVVPLKYLVTEKVAGPYGASLTKAMYTASGYKVYGQQQVIPNDFSIGDYYISQKKFEEMSRYQIFPGDVLFSVMGTVGKVAVVPPDAELGIINPRLVRYKFAPSINPYFLRLLVMSQHYQASLQESAQGSTMEGLNMAILGDLPILLPSREEQNQIVTRLSQEGSLLEELVNQAKYAMSLLSERRSTLISAAVTGKIDVRGWQPPLELSESRETADEV